MTDFNSTLLACEPFVRYAAYTLWRVSENPAGAQHKPVKVPVHYDGITRHSLGRPARGNRPAVAPNPAPPLTAAQAIEWLTYHRTTGTGHDRPGEIGYLGAGFRPQATGLVCIDLDDCVVDGVPNASAQALIARFPGALVELSVSGKGLHIWVTVTGEGPGRRPKQVTALGDIEVYGGGQFIAFGRVLHGDASTDHTLAVHALIAEFWAGHSAAGRGGGGSEEWEALSDAERAIAIEDMPGALPFVPQETYDQWVSAGQAIYTMGEEVGLPMWHALSELGPGYDFDNVEAKWPDLRGERTSYKSIFTKAKANGWTNPRERQPLPSDASSVFAALLPSPLPAGAVLEPPPGRVQAGLDMSFIAAGGGILPATLGKVAEVLATAESGTQLRYDVFKDDQYISIDGDPWRPITNEDEIYLRIRFERRGFKPVSAECMSDAIKAVCRANKVDSALQWVQGLQWDGVPRIGSMLSTYYQAEDTPYTRAVGAYMMTALAGRSIEPGVKADMMPIFIGVQGGGKTTSVEVLSPDPANFGELDMSKKDADLARSLRGKQVMELAELQGLSGRALESTKAWVSRKDEKWIPKFEERETVYKRRILVIGTTNENEILDDPTGERRFLPVKVGTVDIAGLTAVREQLWAEGAHVYRESGVAWREAMRLAPEVHAQHKVHDEWLEMVVRWLAAPPVPTASHPEYFDAKTNAEVPLVLGDVLTAAVRIPAHQIDAKATKRMSKIMRGLNYETRTVWVDGHAVRRWVRR